MCRESRTLILNESKQPDRMPAQTSDPDDLLEIIVGAPNSKQVAAAEKDTLPALDGADPASSRSPNGTVLSVPSESTPAEGTVDNKEDNEGNREDDREDDREDNKEFPPVVSTLPVSEVAESGPANKHTSVDVDRLAPGPMQPQPAVLDDGPQENWLALLVKETLETIVLAVVIFLLIRIGIQNYRIEGSSMEPNFHDGEYLLVNKLAYRLGEYERGDVIVFKYPNDPSKDYIKRVVGLPGDTVEIRDGTLYVNGTPIQEPYPIMSMNGMPYAPTVVEPGYLYVLGDNRPASSDTRDWGLLNQDLVIGKAWLAIWPFDQFGLVDHPDLHFTPGMAQGP